jgi:hypothetical protein
MINYKGEYLDIEEFDRSKVKRFYFSINSYKLNKPNLLDRQIRAVTKRIVSKHSINYQGLEIGTAYDLEDFINNKVTLRLSFNCI